MAHLCFALNSRDTLLHRGYVIFYPKNADFSKVSPHEIKRGQRSLSDRPGMSQAGMCRAKFLNIENKKTRIWPAIYFFVV